LRAAAQEWLPSSIIQRKTKMGFAVDAKEWFKAKAVRDYLSDIFHGSDALHSHLFDGALFVKDLDRCFQKGFSIQDTARVWEVLNIYLWHEKFISSQNEWAQRRTASGHGQENSTRLDRIFLT